MKTGNLIHLLFRLTEVIDSGKSIPLAETEKAIEQGTILDLLGNHIPDFKSFLHQDEKTFLVEKWQGILSAYGSRKFGISNSGYCLILAYCLQTILDNCKE